MQHRFEVKKLGEELVSAKNGSKEIKDA
jgi:hypothetical protein